MSQRVAVAGSSGLVGGALVPALTSRGDTVVRLVRREPSAPDEVQWDPASEHLDPAVLSEVDTIVNLAGAGVGDKRWTTDYKDLLVSSRVDATRTLADAIAAERGRSGRRIRLVNASAVGYYGNRGDEELTEASRPGADFFADLVVAWERATGAASKVGAPVAMTRFGLIMAQDGGAFAPLLRVARLGLGGPFGSGREYWPWVTLNDVVRALLHLIDDRRLTGPFNIVAGATPQRQIARALGKALHRPALLPAPQFALRAVLGEFADSIVASQRVVPKRLPDSDFVFEQAELADAVNWLVAR